MYNVSTLHIIQLCHTQTYFIHEFIYKHYQCLNCYVQEEKPKPIVFKENSYTYPEAATDTKPDIPAAQFLWHYTCYYTFGKRRCTHVITQIHLFSYTSNKTDLRITFAVVYSSCLIKGNTISIDTQSRFLCYIFCKHGDIYTKGTKRYEPSAKFKISKVTKQLQIRPSWEYRAHALISSPSNGY